ncbi:MAG: hypothetical protein OJF51_001245 [Nitrospira sp.]|nr:MAG: hypothetical protein OJF51_001245 [Nitrospira sp.]
MRSYCGLVADSVGNWISGASEQFAENSLFLNICPLSRSIN